MNKKGVIKIIIVLIILVIIFSAASFFLINKQKEKFTKSAIQKQTAPSAQETSNAKNNQIISVEIPMQEPGNIIENTNSNGNSGSGEGSGAGSGDSSETAEPPEESEENTTLPPECIYIRNAKLPQCIIE